MRGNLDAQCNVIFKLYQSNFLENIPNQVESCGILNSSRRLANSPSVHRVNRNNGVNCFESLEKNDRVTFCRPKQQGDGTTARTRSIRNHKIVDGVLLCCSIAISAALTEAVQADPNDIRSETLKLNCPAWRCVFLWSTHYKDLVGNGLP